MSRWLNQVNHLLEKLDGQVETVASATTTTAVTDEDEIDDDEDARYTNNNNRITSPSAAVTSAATTASAAAVSVSRAAAVFGSNFVQQATAIATANRLRSNEDDDDDEYYTDEGDADDYEDEEDYIDDNEDNGEDDEEEEYEIYTEDEEDVEDTEMKNTEPHVPSSADRVVQPTNASEHSNDPNNDQKLEENIIHDKKDQLLDVDVDAEASNKDHEKTLVLPQNGTAIQQQTTDVEQASQLHPTSATTMLLPQTEDPKQKSSVHVLETSSEHISEPQPINAQPHDDQLQSVEQQYQQQIQSLKEQHTLELAKLIQQNDTARQQVIRQNEEDTTKMKEQNEKEKKRMQQQHDNDRKQLLQQNERFQKEVQSLQSELQAVNKELQDAAHIVERERAAAKLERQDILEEQEEELLQMKDGYEEKLQELRIEIKDLKVQYENRLIESKEEHIQLGDTLEDELLQMTDKYEVAQVQMASLQGENTLIQKEIQQWKDQFTTMETNFLNVTERLTTAEAAVMAAEERYDVANEQHRKQSQQRLSREAELEQTIAQLLLSSQQPQQHALSNITHQNGSENKSALEEKQRVDTMIADLRGQYQIAMEDLETTKTDLAIARQQYMVLEQELQEYTQGRQQDAEATQRMQQEYEKRIHTLNQQLEASQQQNLTSSHSVTTSNVSEHLQQLQHELYESKERMVSLSDQVLRQQTVMDTQKSEISSLKSRLKVAITRAETAEAQQPISAMEIELGRVTSTVTNDTFESGSTAVHDPLLPKRRVKGGNQYSRTGPQYRTIRTALGLQQLSSSSVVASQRQRFPRLRSGNNHNGNMTIQQQIGLTIDAIDTWMMETGQVLRQEPLARLGFVMYFCMIHVFCFTLVAFHTIEVEHGDLGHLTDNSRLIGLRHQHQQD